MHWRCGAGLAAYLVVAAVGMGALALVGYRGTAPASAMWQDAVARAESELCGGGRHAGAAAKPAAPIRLSQVWARPATMASAGATASSAMGGSMDGGHAQPAMSGPTSAVYMVLENPGTQPDALVAVRTDVARAAELHRTTMENDVMRMQPVPCIDLPVGEQVELKRGGLHIMLLGVQQPLAPADRFRAVLVFARAGEVPIEVEVREP